MSGIIGSKLNIRGSGGIAKLGTDGQVLTSSGAGVTAAFEDAAGGGLDWQTIETGSTMTAVAGNGYWIDTTSNACTITLPASASNGDEIMFADYARNWGTNAITIDSNGLNYQGDDDSYNVEYTTDGQSLHIVYSGATNGWIPIEDDAVDDAPEAPSANPTGIFGFGDTGSRTGITNLVSNAGVVASDTAAVGTARDGSPGCEYGNDKGIFAFGNDGSRTNVSNLVSNLGVVQSDQAATTGTSRDYLAACTYGGDKGIFGGGNDGSAPYVGITNLVTNLGVVGTDVAAVMTARSGLVGCEYSANKDKGIFGLGYAAPPTARVGMTNLVTNLGVVGTDVTAVATANTGATACDYGTDKGIFGFGEPGAATAVTNLVSNTGVVATAQTAVTGSARIGLAACEYAGKDGKAIFGFGYNGGTKYGLTNLVSNTGVVASDVAAVGSERSWIGACSWG